jgi:hypothetical protein
MNREALKARHVDAQGTSIVLEGFLWKPVYFAPSALRHVAIAHPARWAGLLHFAPLALKTTMQITRLIRQVYKALLRPGIRVIRVPSSRSDD